MTDEERALKELLIATLMESDEVIEAMESYSITLRGKAGRLDTLGRAGNADAFADAYIAYVRHFTGVCKEILTA